MKKIYFNIVLIIVILCVGFTSSEKLSAQSMEDVTAYQQSNTIAVLAIPALTGQPYQDTTMKVGNAIISKLRRETDLNVLNLAISARMIKEPKIKRLFKTISKDYRDFGTVDPDIIGLLAEEMQASKFLFVSSGFDFDKNFLDKSLRNKLFVFNDDSLNSKNTYIVTLSIIEPSTGFSDWQKSYKKEFSTKDFALFSDKLSNDVILSNAFSHFTDDLSKAVVKDLEKTYSYLVTPVVRATIVDPNKFTKDGILTTDGHSPLLEDSATEEAFKEPLQPSFVDDMIQEEKTKDIKQSPKPVPIQEKNANKNDSNEHLEALPISEDKESIDTKTPPDAEIDIKPNETGASKTSETPQADEKASTEIKEEQSLPLEETKGPQNFSTPIKSGNENVSSYKEDIIKRLKTSQSGESE